MRNVTKRIQLCCYLTSLGFLDMLSIANKQPLVATFIFLMLAVSGGYLLTLMAGLRSKLERVVVGLGLSMAILMGEGLLLNTLLPVFGILHPLNKSVDLVAFNVTIVMCALFGIKAQRTIKLRKPRLGRQAWVLVLASALSPILACLGAIQLNNGAQGTLAVFNVFYIGLIAFTVVAIRRKLPPKVLPGILYLLGLSLLLMFSMRSNYLSGWDVNEEYQVYGITLSHLRWSYNFLPGDYNSCLSLTILPVMVNKVTGLGGVQFFKLFIPLVFSFVPLSVFAIARRLKLSSTASFMAAMLFISQVQFLIDPGWARQDIALAFFSLIVLLLLDPVKSVLNRVFFLVFCFGMIVSHYSTAYVGILLLVLLALAVSLSSRFKRSKISHSLLKAPIMAIVLLFGIFWYGQITSASSNILKFAEKSITGIFESSNGAYSSTSLPLNQLDFLKPNVSLPDFDKYVSTVVPQYRSSNSKSQFYSSHLSDYSVTPTQGYVSPIKIQHSLYSVTTIFGRLVVDLMKATVVLLPVLCLFVKCDSSLSRKVRNYVICGTLATLAIFILVPYATVDFGLPRLSQQLLVVLAPASVFALAFGLKNKFGDRKIFRYGPEAFVVFVIVFMFYNLGAIAQLTGGYNGFYWLDNYGDQYNESYERKGEVLSAKWLVESQDTNVIYSDKPGFDRLSAYGNVTVPVREVVIPQTITKSAYVYTRYDNVVNGEGAFDNDFLGGARPEYNYPNAFLNESKNTIYSDGETKIFK